MQNRAKEQDIYRVAEILRERDPLYHKDARAMYSRLTKVHPTDYTKLYTAAARIVVECAVRLSEVPLHPEMHSRNYMHWLAVLLGARMDDFVFGDLDPTEALPPHTTEALPPNGENQLTRSHEPVGWGGRYLSDGKEG